MERRQTPHLHSQPSPLDPPGLAAYLLLRAHILEGERISFCVGGEVGEWGGALQGAVWGLQHPSPNETFHLSEPYCKFGAPKGEQDTCGCRPSRQWKHPNGHLQVLTLLLGSTLSSLFFVLSLRLFCFTSLFFFLTTTAPSPTPLSHFPFLHPVLPPLSLISRLLAGSLCLILAGFTSSLLSFCHPCTSDFFSLSPTHKSWHLSTLPPNVYLSGGTTRNRSCLVAERASCHMWTQKSGVSMTDKQEITEEPGMAKDLLAD